MALASKLSLRESRTTNPVTPFWDGLVAPAGSSRDLGDTGRRRFHEHDAEALLFQPEPTTATSPSP